MSSERSGAVDLCRTGNDGSISSVMASQPAPTVGEGSIAIAAVHQVLHE
jgi:hypothetical protein